jgi:hypothetical protein
VIWPRDEVGVITLWRQGARLGVASLPGGQSAGNGKALRRTIRRSAREGGLRLRLQSVAKAKPPGIEAVSSTSAANRTGSIGQYGAESQVAHEIRAKQDSGASLSTAGGRDESERLDAGRAGSKGGSLGALRKGVGGWRYAATPLLPPPTCEGPRRERLGPGVLKTLCKVSKAWPNPCRSPAEHPPTGTRTTRIGEDRQ